MKENVSEYFTILRNKFTEIIATNLDGKVYKFEEAISKSADLILKHTTAGGKIFFIGNGASAAISSHMAADFLKNGKIRAIAFNDPVLLTCVSNDFGYSYVFEKPIEIFANSNDILVAISSSGESENIIKAVHMAKLKGCFIISLSGFNKNNPLRSQGQLNFYVASSLYGHVEVVHHAICHCILDTIILKKNKKSQR